MRIVPKNLRGKNNSDDLWDDTDGLPHCLPSFVLIRSIPLAIYLIIFQTYSAWILKSQRCITKSFDSPPSHSLSSAGSGALTFCQCFRNEGWGGGSLVPLQCIPNLQCVCMFPLRRQKLGFSVKLWSKVLSSQEQLMKNTTKKLT